MNTSPTLRELLALAADHRNGASGRGLATLAAAEGFDVSHATINKIRAGTYKSTPSAETLKAIAWLAGVPEAVAFEAAGMDVPGPPFAEELPPGVDLLSAKKRKAAIEMLRVLVEAEEREREFGRAFRQAAAGNEHRPGSPR